MHDAGGIILGNDPTPVRARQHSGTQATHEQPHLVDRTGDDDSATCPHDGPPGSRDDLGCAATSPPSGVRSDAGKAANLSGPSSSTDDAYWKSMGISTATGPRGHVIASTMACATVAPTPSADGGR